MQNMLKSRPNALVGIIKISLQCVQSSIYLTCGPSWVDYLSSLGQIFEPFLQVFHTVFSTLTELLLTVKYLSNKLNTEEKDPAQIKSSNANSLYPFTQTSLEIRIHIHFSVKKKVLVIQCTV